jgi:hypothetical protein
VKSLVNIYNIANDKTNIPTIKIVGISFGAGYGGLFAFSPLVKIVVWIPSSRDPADVHRTSAFHRFDPFHSKKKDHPTGGLSFWSRIRESNPTTLVVALGLFAFMAEFVAELVLDF